MGKLITKTLEEIRNTPLTAAQRRRLERLAQLPDEEIDLSDIPELTEDFWKNAVRNPYYRPNKQQITLRLDADVIAWLRREGRGYQTRLNELLRTKMREEIVQRALEAQKPGPTTARSKKSGRGRR